VSAAYNPPKKPFVGFERTRPFAPQVGEMGRPFCHQPLETNDSNAHAVASHNLGVPGFLPNRLTVFGVDFADFGLGVFVKLVHHPAGQIIEQIPAGTFVDAGLLFMEPGKDGPERFRSVVGQLVSGIGGSGFEFGERNLVAGEELGGELLRLGFGASQGWKVRQSDKGLLLVSMTIGPELQARQQGPSRRASCHARLCLLPLFNNPTECFTGDESDGQEVIASERGGCFPLLAVAIAAF